MRRGPVCLVWWVWRVEIENLAALRLRRGRRYDGRCLRREVVWTDAEARALGEHLLRRQHCDCLADSDDVVAEKQSVGQIPVILCRPV